MAAKVGKKKKKGTTMALTDFLSDEQGNVQGPGSSYVLANKSMDLDWAAEMEQLDTTYPEPSYGDKMIDRTKLPTAPKASRGADVDLASLPNDPPFTAFIGNLPYEATEDKIAEFFQRLPVVNVRLPEENGRLRGFGYVEFETKQALLDALAMSEDTMSGRKIRIDLAGQGQHGDRDRQGGSRDSGRGGDPDRTEGDWRRREPVSDGGGSGGSAWGRDRDGGDRYGGREGGRSDTDGPWERRSYQDAGPRGGGGFDERGGSGYRDRYGDRDRDRGGGRDSYGDRGGGFRDSFGDRGGRDSFGDRGGGRDGFGDRDGGRRGYGSSFQRNDRDGDRYGGDRRGYSDRYGDREPGGFGGDRDRGFGGDRDRGFGGDRDRGYGDRGRDDGYGHRSERQPSREPGESSHDDGPKERPRLHLQPRSKPAEAAAPKTADSKSAIFGGAKPVDTAQKEREIEARLMKERDTVPLPVRTHRYDDDDKENRDRDSYNTERSSGPYDRSATGADRSSGGRRRSDSDRSQDGDSRRERRLSSGSGKSRKAPPPVTSQRSRKDSDHSSHSNEVFSGGEDQRDREDSSHAPLSPSQRDEPPAKLVPAPPPKENIWEKRKTQFSPPQKQDQPRSPPAQQSAPSSDSSSSPASQTVHPSKPQPAPSEVSQRPPQSQTPPKDEVKKNMVPAEPPKENPWMKRKMERDHQVTTTTRADGPTPSDNPVPAWGPGGADRGRGRGRGGSGERGRGRGARPQPKQVKEKPLPQSIDEMPKAEEAPTKDFSDGNKFAGLVEDEED